MATLLIHTGIIGMPSVGDVMVSFLLAVVASVAVSVVPLLLTSVVILLPLVIVANVTVLSLLRPANVVADNIVFDATLAAAVEVVL